MEYSRVYMDAIAYELPPVVVTTHELEARLQPVYEQLHISSGQLEALTGISERRWWNPDTRLSEAASLAGKKALEASGVSAEAIDAVIYAGVCREQFEPATACNVAALLGVNNASSIYDISNACLGVLNGIIDVANKIELGQIRSGLVVSCETAREINDITIQRMLDASQNAIKNQSAKQGVMELFTQSLATLTGGSGAVAVLLTDGSFSEEKGHQLLGAVTRTAPQHNALCRWGMETILSTDSYQQIMSTDSVAVLKYGVELGLKTWELFLDRLNWNRDKVDKVICHQVGSGHQEKILKTLGIPLDKDFSTYKFLGNIGTVSVPLTAALATERTFINAGDQVAFLGIGSGLNCMMLGFRW